MPVIVVAQRKLSADDLKCVQLYNELQDRDFDVPDKLVAHLKATGAVLMDPGKKTATVGEVIEIDVKGDGNVKYGNGMTIDIASLPPDTIALRIFMRGKPPRAPVSWI